MTGPAGKNTNSSAWNRRTFLGAGAAAVAGSALLGGCSRAQSSSGGSGGEPIKFWNMHWGEHFDKVDKKITEDYEPKKGLPKATHQTIQWDDFDQKFSSAIASNTGPAVSSGGGTQAFRFAAENKIAYADDLLDSWKSNGLYDDFLPGLIDTMKTDKGYAAVPYNLDMRVMWYNKRLMKKAGVKPPTDWKSYLHACAGLKKIGVYGFTPGAVKGGFTGAHVLVCWMINNGGGLFDKDQQPDCVTSANVEAMKYVRELIHKGYMDPGSVAYTSDNVSKQWKAHKFGMGFDTLGLADNIGGDVKDELVVGTPLKGPSGKKGALYFPNNIMMYTETPSQKGSEAFMTYYYKNMSPLWKKDTGIGLPPLKSLTKLKEVGGDKNKKTAIDEWQSISRTWAAPGGDALFRNVNVADGSTAMDEFTQEILGGKKTVKDALKKLEKSMKAHMKK